MNNLEYWESRWKNHETGWDLLAPSPPLTAYIDQIPPEKRDMRILIPGCGNGYEALYLLEKGFTNVTMLDISPTAVELMRSRLDEFYSNWPLRLRLVCGDFFTHEGEYDLVLEQTFFCALDPSLREDYVKKMQQLLAPKGKLAGVLFNRAFEGGPPFGGNTEEYKTLFSPYFHLKTMEKCYNSVLPREGVEVFIVFEKITPAT